MRRTPPPCCPWGRIGGTRPTKLDWFVQQTKSFTVDIRAKPEYHKFLIGKGGGKIRKVRDSTGARIVFPAAEDREQDLITIIGKEDAVREAQRELEALIQNLVSWAGGAGPGGGRRAGGGSCRTLPNAPGQRG